MKVLLLATVSILFASGCAAPRYTGTSIENAIVTSAPELVVMRDNATKSGFLETIELWLNSNDYKYTVVPDGSSHNSDKIMIEYVGHWSWDLALYLSNAEIEAFYKGQRIGQVTYKAPNTLNTNKFSEADERIEYMLEVLFGKIDASTATQAIKKKTKRK